jgi:hypothetical protein
LGRARKLSGPMERHRIGISGGERAAVPRRPPIDE